MLAAVIVAGTACGAAATAGPNGSAGATPPTASAAEPSIASAASPSTPSTAAPSTSSTATPTTAAATEPPTPAPTPTVVRTERPTSTPQPTARSAKYTTLPPSATLPTDQQCASEASSDPWEPRPDNRAPNLTNAWSQGFRLRGSYLAATAPGYEERVTGNFTGTTDQILRWAACKWGFDEDDVRAQAVIESYWRQSLLADCRGTTQPETNGCASVGLLAVKGADIPATHPGTWPAARTSTAFNVDYALAVRRLCYDGKETWMRQFNATYAAGDVWGCIGRWFSGRWHDPNAETYIQRVRATLSARTWLSSSF